MNKTDIELKILFVFNLLLKVDQINIASNMDNTDGWDSLMHIQILTAIEAEFNIELKFEDTLNMLDIKNIIDTVSSYIN